MTSPRMAQWCCASVATTGECGSDSSVDTCPCLHVCVVNRAYMLSPPAPIDLFTLVPQVHVYIVLMCYHNHSLCYCVLHYAHCRWWPAQVVPEKSVPEHMLSSKPAKGMFLVLFYGTGQYQWTNHGRVIAFTDDADWVEVMVKKSSNHHSTKAGDQVALFRKGKHWMNTWYHITHVYNIYTASTHVQCTYMHSGIYTSLYMYNMIIVCQVL